MAGDAAAKTLALFNRFITGTMGLFYREERLAELGQRMATVCREFGFADPEQCMLWLMSAPPSKEQLEVLARALTIGETYFFRDPQSYRVLETEILPALIRSRLKEEKRLRIWSAGCSTGEEPYSIAILLSRMLGNLGDWNITILATDLNPQALEKARRGIYRQWSFRDAPPWLMDYFEKQQDGSFEITPRIRNMVQFGCLNLAEECYPAIFNNTNAMDVIFCRNVLLYFAPELIRSVASRFHNALLEGGWLFVSPSEASHHYFTGFSCRRRHGVILFRKEQEPAAGASFPARGTETFLPLPVSAPPLPGIVAAPPPPFLEAAGIPAPVAAIPPAADGYPEALALFEEGHYEMAVAKARERLALQPGDPDLLELLARTYANLGKFAEARQWCEQALVADRLRARNYYLLANIMLEQGLPAEATAELNRTLYIDHDFLLAYFTLGNLHLQAGRKREAQRGFANALRLLERRDPHEVLPEAEGMTAGQLAGIIRAMNQGEESE
jgi:chemotaxis protein methyltransferase CheR